MLIDKRFKDNFKNLKQVFLYITDECNLSCIQCLYKPNLIEKKKISPHLAKMLLQACRELGAFKLTILGGECTLYDIDSLCSVISFAKNIGYRYIRIDTNGVFNPDLFQKELFPLLNEISFSIDGYDSETNNSLRGNDSFSITTSNLKIAVANGLNVHITSCVTKQNTKIAGSIENFLLSMIRFAEKERVNSLNFHGVFKMGTPMDVWTGDSHLHPNDWYNAVYNMRKILDKNIFSVKIRLPLHVVKKEEFDSNPKYYGYCPSKLGERVLIHPTGMIRICSSLLSTCYGSAFFNEEKIVWNEFSNELDDVDCGLLTPCSHQKALYTQGYVPVCFSLKPHQQEIVWEELKSCNVIDEY